MDAPDDRREVRHEHEAYFTFCRLREPLPDLGPMPVARHVVGDEIVRRLGVAEVQLCLASGAAHAGLCVGDQVVEIHRAALDERQEAELDRGRVATGICHQPRAADALAVDLTQAVDRVAHQLGRAVLHLVPALPFGDVADAEIGRKVDDARARIEHRTRILHRNAVRRTEKDDVTAAQRLRRWLGELEIDVPAQARETGRSPACPLPCAR